MKGGEVTKRPRLFSQPSLPPLVATAVSPLGLKEEDATKEGLAKKRGLNVHA